MAIIKNKDEVSEHSQSDREQGHIELPSSYADNPNNPMVSIYLAASNLSFSYTLLPSLSSCQVYPHTPYTALSSQLISCMRSHAAYISIRIWHVVLTLWTPNS
jgi:hypothetical protein